MALLGFSWDIPVLVEEVFFGLAAGLFIIAALLSLRNQANNTMIIRFGYIGAAVLSILGLVTLVAELGRPERAANAINNLLILGTSVMSRTVPVLLAFTVLSVIVLLFWTMPSKAVKVRRVFEVLGLASAFPAGMQAGILLMAASKRPLWNTPILPYLYLFTGILAAIGLYGIVLSRTRTSYEKNLSLLSSMTYYSVFLIIVSALATVVHLVAVEVPEAVLTLFANPFPLAAPTFLIGYILVGLVFPAAHAYLAYAVKEPLSRNIMLRFYISLIIGAVALRASFLYAGQLYFR
jgi:formate-dependent nitrite reductase membrane component NrfD